MHIATILVVDDEQDLLDLITFNLARSHYRVLSARDGEQALNLARKEQPDLILLDLMLPGKTGQEVTVALRSDPVTRDIPVVMLTARTEESDIVVGLQLGADDYVTKPFEMDELLARIRALLRRAEGEEILRIADLEVNTATREVRRGERDIDLTAREYELLEFMARNPRRVLSREFLLSRVWDQEFGVTTNVVEVYIAYLRKKVDAPGEQKLIHTVRGAGYALKGG